ncbi:MAG: hypothetical protein Q4C73_03110 [Eubacteriales bacterium]|nr:hypothetical protein [Eubacteriales bacterium]
MVSVEKKTLPPDAYAIRLQLGRSVGTGTYEITRIGTRREINRYAVTYQTAAAGDLDPEEWRKGISAAIVECGETELLERIVEDCRRRCSWFKTDEELIEYAMSCLANRAYKYWDGFQDKYLCEEVADGKIDNPG